MKQLLAIISLFGGTCLAQEPSTIHQEQQDYYNSLGQSTEWYEDNVNTTVHAFPKMTGCNLEKVVYGWHPYWVGSAYNNYDWDLLSHFSFFSYEVDAATGNALSTHGWATSSAVDAALASGNTKVTLCVTLFGSSGLTTFLTNATAKQTLITNLINLVQSRGAHGVNIDFEGLPTSQKTNFANFMVDLSNQMHAAIPGSEVSTVLYAVDWSNVFDFAIMDPVVDHYIIMGYAYYYQGSSSTGPCDPLYHFGSTYNYTLSKTITYYLDKGASKDKLVMGLPYYGYEWPTVDLNIPSSTTGSGSAKTYANVMNNTSGNYSSSNHTWDADSYTDIYTFTSGGNKQCFITLEDGFRKRLEHINQSGIAGIGIWALGYDDGYAELWNSISDYLTDCYEDPCSGTIHDFGGPNKNYYNDEDYTWTIAPPGATSIDVNFTMFDVELNYDTLFIYDGSSSSAPIWGTYTGTSSPGSFTSSTGALTFRFKSDGATVDPGFMATYSCTITDPPLAGFNNPGAISVCENEPVSFTNTSSNASSYYWEFEGASPATSTSANPTVWYSSSGNNDVTLYAIEGTDTSVLTQSVTVNVVPLPNAVFSTNSPVYWPNSTIVFSNASSSASAYTWDFGDGNLSTDVNPWNIYSAPGIYQVMLVASNFACDDDTSITLVEIIDNVGLINNELQVLLYPNPFQDQIRVQLPSPGIFELSIYTSSGQLVKRNTLSAEGEAVLIDGLEDLPEGEYLFEFRQGDQIHRIPVIRN